MYIKDVFIPGYTVLAPMAGVTDLAFRTVCRMHGASLTYTEMVSAKGLVYHDRKSPRIMRLGTDEHPAAVQIFGSDPDAVREGARIASHLSGADLLDINMGCPTPKIASNGDGSALMRNPALAARVIRAAVEGSCVPVTVKIRLGWDAGSINAVEFAKMAEDSGAAAICVHGRTREQMYAGRADWARIAAVRSAVSVPVIANGDVASPEDALSILRETGADLCMIGRASLGNPWIFARAEAALAGNPLADTPPLWERLATARRQMMLAVEDKGEHIAMLEARKHLMWYLKGLRGTAGFKERISKITTVSDMDDILSSLLEEDAKGRWQI